MRGLRTSFAPVPDPYGPSAGKTYQSGGCLAKRGFVHLCSAGCIPMVLFR